MKENFRFFKFTHEIYISHLKNVKYSIIFVELNIH